MLVGTRAEGRFYKPLANAVPGAGRRRLAEERFVDPDSWALVGVYRHDRTGERRYVRLPVRPGSRCRLGGGYCVSWMVLPPKNDARL